MPAPVREYLSEATPPIPRSAVVRREWVAARARAGLAARTARARLSDGRDRAGLDALLAHRRVVREQQRLCAVRGVLAAARRKARYRDQRDHHERGKTMGDVHIGRIRDVAAVLRLLDELREDLNDAQAPTSTIEAVDDLRAEARKPKPSKDVTDQLMDGLADRGLGVQMKELANAFDALF